MIRKKLNLNDMTDIKDIPKENLEIERKFLLKDVPVFPNGQNADGTSIDVLNIHQIYLEENKVTRYRMTQYKDGKIVCHKCNKRELSHGVFEELEEEITKELFDEKSEILPHREIVKTRYVYKEGGLNWEIDDYHMMKVVTLEVELDDIEQKISIPEHIKPWLIKELTGEREFSNYSLSAEIG